MGTHQGLGGAMLGAEEGDFPPISASQGGRSGAGEPQGAREAVSITGISLMSGISCPGEESMALT